MRSRSPGQSSQAAARPSIKIRAANAAKRRFMRTPTLGPKPATKLDPNALLVLLVEERARKQSSAIEDPGNAVCISFPEPDSLISFIHSAEAMRGHRVLFHVGQFRSFLSDAWARQDGIDLLHSHVRTKLFEG